MNAILFKGGGYNILSNMAAYAIEWHGKYYMTTEHVYQSAKFNDKELQTRIREAPSAYAAKMLAEEHQEKVRQDWNEQKLAFMEELLRAKLSQHPHVREKLLDSGRVELIEDTDDTFWGRGQSGTGANHLGKLWMKLRDEITVNNAS